MVIEPSGNEVELCRVGTNPQAIAKAALSMTARVKYGRKWHAIPRYCAVRIKEIGIEPERGP